MRTKIFFYFLAAILCLSVAVQLPAQSYKYKFKDYSSYNGLSHSDITCVLVDSKGLLWVGTHYGLNRFDGKFFKSYLHNTNRPFPIMENDILGMDEDNDGNIWLAIYNSGVSMLERKTGKYINFRMQDSMGKKILCSRKVTAIKVDHNNRVWVGTENGITCLDIKGRPLRHTIGVQRSQSPIIVQSFYQDSRNNLWANTLSSGLLRWDEKKSSWIQVVVNTYKGFYNMTEDSVGHAWFATGDGLFYSYISNFFSNQVNLRRAEFFQQSVAVGDVKHDEKGQVWVATRTNGLYIYNPALGLLDHFKEDLALPNGLLNNRIVSLYKDSKGGMWICEESGLQCYYEKAIQFSVYPELGPLSPEIKGAIIYDIFNYNNEIIVNHSGGLIVFDRFNKRFLPVLYRPNNSNIPFNNLRCRGLTTMGESRWWVTTDHGILELKREKEAYILSTPVYNGRDFGFADQDIRAIKWDQEGKLWIGTYNQGVICYDPENGQRKIFKHKEGDSQSLADDVINQIRMAPDGTLMICTDNGLSTIRSGDSIFKSYQHNYSKPGETLNDIHIYDCYDDGQKVWIATFGGGLNCLDKKTGTFTYYTTDEGLCSDAIYTMEPIGDSVLWMGTNNGLSRFRFRDSSFSNYSAVDGLPADEFNMFSAHMDYNQEMFMGTIQGVVSFFPDKIKSSTIEPDIHLARIRLNESQMSDSALNYLNSNKVLKLDYTDQVQMEFSSLDYSNPDFVYFHYQIPQVSDRWVEMSGNNLVQLMPLKPGNYDLILEPTLEGYEGKRWEMKIEVAPPFWQTWWFRMFVMILLGILILFFIRSYLAQRLKNQQVEFEQQRAVEAERARISSELHDDIGGSLTAIRLMSEMMKDKAPQGIFHASLEKISNSSNELIQRMNEIVWALNINHDNLQSLVAYTRQFAVAYLDDLDIQCNVDLPEQIPEVVVPGIKRRAIFLSVKEALNNIAKHSEATEVNIRFSVNDQFQIILEDNGKGFDPYNVRINANGLVNQRRRMAELNGKVQLETEPGSGTRIIFTIPYSTLSEKPKISFEKKNT